MKLKGRKDSSGSKDVWDKFFLYLTPEERSLVQLAPILLVCNEQDCGDVGALVWSHFINNDEWQGSFRYTAGVIARILNKRFPTKTYTYLDFYCSNLQFWDPQKQTSTLAKTQRKMERKYKTPVCKNCKGR